MSTNKTKTNKTIKNEKEIKKMAKKTNVNEKEIKEMKTGANTFKAGSKVTSGRLTVSHLLKTINNSKYNSISDIIGDCEAVIERYEYGVGVTHSNNTFVYSMRSENPEAEDIQPSDKVWGYVKLFVRIIKDSTEQYTSLTVYEDNFDRFATSLMAVLNIDNTYEAASLRTLLNDAVASGTRVPITRVKKESYMVTYWARYTHQPKYKLDYTLHSAQNAALFEEAFCNALYYPALEYNTVYKVKIDNCYIQHKVQPITKYDHITKTYITVEEDTVTRFLLKLVSDEGYVYRIDTKIDIAIDKTLESLCAAAALPEELENIDDVSDFLIGRKFLFSVMLDYSETTQTQYEVFAFGKEVK